MKPREMTPDTQEPRLIQLKIGSKRYSIATDDEYLRNNGPGLKVRIKNSLKALVGGNTFEPRMTRLFSTLIQPTDTVLDIGANIGCTTLLFSELGSHVHAFEPLGKTFALLRRNVEVNVRGNIKIHHCALGDENKNAEICFSDTNRSIAFVLDRTSRDDRGTSPITVRRLDDMLPELRIDSLNFMKIDVEGYEMRVLNGARKTLAKYNPVVEMEFVAWCLDVQQRTTLPDFSDLVTELFPIVYVVDGRRYIDIHTTRGRYEAMAQNMFHHRYKELVCAYVPDQLVKFSSVYTDATPK